jgi:hypothetical protein
VVVVWGIGLFRNFQEVLQVKLTLLLQTCQDESGHLGRNLFHLIQAPLTRIPHYVSIAQLLVKYTDHLHPDYAMIVQYAQRMQLIAADVQNL